MDVSYVKNFLMFTVLVLGIVTFIASVNLRNKVNKQGEVTISFHDFAITQLGSVYALPLDTPTQGCFHIVDIPSSYGFVGIANLTGFDENATYGYSGEYTNTADLCYYYDEPMWGVDFKKFAPFIYLTQLGTPGMTPPTASISPTAAPLARFSRESRLARREMRLARTQQTSNSTISQSH